MAFALVQGYSKIIDLDESVTVLPSDVSLAINIAKEPRIVQLPDLPSRPIVVSVRNKGAEMLLVDAAGIENVLASGHYIILSCKTGEWKVLAEGVAGTDTGANTTKTIASTLSTVTESVIEPVVEPTQITRYPPMSPMVRVKTLKKR